MPSIQIIRSKCKFKHNLRLNSCKRKLAEFASFWNMTKLQSILIMVIVLCLLPVPPPPIWSGSQSAKQYLKKTPTTNTPPPILVQTILLLLPKSLIHADTLRVLILTTSTVILSDHLSNSIYFFSLSQWNSEMYFCSGDIDNSMLFKMVLLQEQYNGRLQTSSEEKLCVSQIMCGSCWHLSSLDVPVQLHLGFAAVWMACRMDRISCVHCSLSHLCCLLNGPVEEGFAKTCKLNQSTFWMMLRSIFISLRNEFSLSSRWFFLWENF